MSRALVALLLSACSASQPCRPGTVLLHVRLGGAALSANWIDVALSVDGGPSRAQMVQLTSQAASGSLEVDFTQGYPEGHSLSFSMTARLDGTILASAQATTTAMPGCTTLSLDLSDADLGQSTPPDLTGLDLGGVDSRDLAAASDLSFVPGPSCSNMAATCGPSGADNCCASPPVSGGSFFRSYDGVVGGYVDKSNPATVSDFRLDKYEVSVARFRHFVNAGMGTAASPPPAGSGANPYITNSGWDPGWNSSLAADTPSLKAAVKGSPGSFCTWTDALGTNENRPINCITWYEAFAFCAWDGGFLPTEAEWNFAAAGGDQQRAYPWSSTADPLAIDNSYAVYCPSCNASGNIGLVGSKSPKGDGRWGQSDLAGNVREWVLDVLYATATNQLPYLNPCSDCADFRPSMGSIINNRVFRGGDYYSSEGLLRSAKRGYENIIARREGIGVRCARHP